MHEKDQGCLDALLLSPIDRPVIFFGKAIGNLHLPAHRRGASILPLFFFIFLRGQARIGGAGLDARAARCFVGSIGIAGVGTLLATMSVNTTGKDFILAVLFIPIMFPLLLAVVAATSAVLIGEPGLRGRVLADAWRLRGGYDAIMLLAAFGSVRVRPRRLERRVCSREGATMKQIRVAIVAGYRRRA